MAVERPLALLEDLVVEHRVNRERIGPMPMSGAICVKNDLHIHILGQPSTAALDCPNGEPEIFVCFCPGSWLTENLRQQAAGRTHPLTGVALYWGLPIDHPENPEMLHVFSYLGIIPS